MKFLILLLAEALYDQLIRLEVNRPSFLRVTMLGDFARIERLYQPPLLSSWSWPFFFSFVKEPHMPTSSSRHPEYSSLDDLRESALSSFTGVFAFKYCPSFIVSDYSLLLWVALSFEWTFDYHDQVLLPIREVKWPDIYQLLYFTLHHKTIFDRITNKSIWRQYLGSVVLSISSRPSKFIRPCSITSSNISYTASLGKEYFPLLLRSYLIHLLCDNVAYLELRGFDWLDLLDELDLGT